MPFAGSDPLAISIRKFEAHRSSLVEQMARGCPDFPAYRQLVGEIKTYDNTLAELREAHFKLFKE